MIDKLYTVILFESLNVFVHITHYNVCIYHLHAEVHSQKLEVRMEEEWEDDSRYFLKCNIDLDCCWKGKIKRFYNTTVIFLFELNLIFKLDSHIIIYYMFKYFECQVPVLYTCVPLIFCTVHCTFYILVRSARTHNANGKRYFRSIPFPFFPAHGEWRMENAKMS